MSYFDKLETVVQNIETHLLHKDNQSEEEIRKRIKQFMAEERRTVMNSGIRRWNETERSSRSIREIINNRVLCS